MPTRAQLLSQGLLFILMAVLTITALRIEILNHQAGGILPRRAEIGTDGALSKWREIPTPATSTEVATNQLRAVVATWGVAQYPLAACTSVLSLPALRGARSRVLPTMALLIALLALALAVVRAYFTSLGW